MAAETNYDLKAQAARAYAARFGAAPQIVAFAPGRVNLLGEHTEWLVIWPTDDWVMSLVATACFAVATITGVLMLLWRDDETEVALLVTLGAGLVVFAGFHLAYISIALYNVAGLVQVLSILRSSHAMAYRDDLTGLLGRRALNERLEQAAPEVLASRRSPTVAAVETAGGDQPLVTLPIGSSMEEVEREMIRSTLAHTEGNKTRAAKILGISLKTMHNKVKKFGL